MGERRTIMGYEVEISYILQDNQVLFAGGRITMNPSTLADIRDGLGGPAWEAFEDRGDAPRNWDRNPVRQEALRFLSATPPARRGISFGALT